MRKAIFPPVSLLHDSLSSEGEGGEGKMSYTRAGERKMQGSGISVLIHAFSILEPDGKVARFQDVVTDELYCITCHPQSYLLTLD
jgi:hypothetical protein